MMGVSPWFYTNVPGKNWLWSGDDLWYNRWQQAIELQPELVQIISWNDYGESHYIGPIRSPGIPSGAGWYVSNNSHDAWRDMLPYYIAAYKNGNTTSPSIPQETLVYYYRPNPSSSGSSGGTAGNSVQNGQTPYPPAEVSLDMVFLDVLVSAPADINVQIGSNAPTSLKATTAGVNHFSVPFNSQLGNVTFAVTRNGQDVVGATGQAITGDCVDGMVNWNAVVGGSS